MNKLTQIVDGGYCIGCGACANRHSDLVSIGLDELGQFQAKVKDGLSLPSEVEAELLSICPFSNDGPNEDAISDQSFDPEYPRHNGIGAYSGLYAGYVAEGNFRSIASSGGVITWLACQLLHRGMVDGVVHVKKDTSNSETLFKYGISRTEKEVIAGSKSRYYPVEMSEVISEISRTPGRYVVIGLPCFVKAIRRLALIDPVLNSRVVYTIGLVCGHLKSKAFADLFGWQAGISPGGLEEIDFRVKMPSGAPNKYGTRVKGAGISETRRVDEFFGWNWKYNSFRYSACDYCDDVFAETADICIGDAWLPEYSKEPKGTSVIVVRGAEIQKIIAEGLKHDELKFSKISPEKMLASQAGGLRDRREGLAYRLYLKFREKVPFPKKRVDPSKKGIGYWRRRIYEQRILLRVTSHSAWLRAIAATNFSIFKREMEPLMARSDFLYKMSFKWFVGRIKRFVGGIKRKALSFLKMITG